MADLEKSHFRLHMTGSVSKEQDKSAMLCAYILPY